MSSPAISPDVLRLIEKMSHLTIEEIQEAESFIDFLRSKKESKSHYSDIVPDNTKDTSHAETSDFIASFASFPLSRSDVSEMQPQSGSESSLFPLYVPEKFIERNDMLNESNHVIVAPEEPIAENFPSDIDFADINARFAKKREENREKQNNNEIHSKDLDWL
ncbi:MAG: hypothetical protein FWF19_04795 [Euryarchaeota archaeon]|nr:hypothetical protein [Euryarchaeota archaeon]